MSAPDQISQKYFNQRGIHITVDASVDADEFDIFDNVDTLARLTGAPDESDIRVSRGTGGSDTFNLSVSNGIYKYPAEYIILNQGGKLNFELNIDSIYVRERYQDQGIGVRSVMLSIEEAKRNNFNAVTLHAAGSAKDRSMFFGYHVWPSMGFDALLPTEIRQKLPANLSGCIFISDLIKTDEGCEWWYDWGVPIDLAFDLTDGSVSWQLLHGYADAKGISL